MPYSEALAARIRPLLARRKNVEERKMFGGTVFLFSSHMGVGVWQDSAARTPSSANSAGC